MDFDGAVRTPVRGFTRLIVKREPFSEVMIVELPDGSSYLKEIEDLKLWLLQAGVDHLQIDRLVDHAWNFYKVGYDLEEQRPYLEV